MIYECPNCHAPQRAGHTACPECGAEFDGPVPDDAVLPEPAPSAARPTASEPPSEALAELPSEMPADPKETTAGAAAYDAPEPALEAAPISGAEAAPGDAPGDPPPTPRVEPSAPLGPVLEEVRPAVEDLPYRPSSYAPPPPAYTPPAYTPPAAHAGGSQTPQARPARPSALPRALLIAAPIVLILVVGGLLYSRSLDSVGDAATAPLPAAASSPAPPAASTPAATPAGPATILPAGTATGAVPEDPHVKWLAGRWQAKSTDFYVFNDNGSGSQGSLTGRLPTQDFLWRLVQNQLVLYGSPKDQQLRFSVGPDDNTMYLRDAAGHATQFTRAKPEPSNP